jgi:hypothetical protein
MCILGGSLYAADVVVPATMSCRTTILQPNDCTADSSKLSIRSDASSNKSWIRFDLGANDPITVRSAILTLVTIDAGRTGTFDVSAVNDDCHDNDIWTDAKGSPAVPPAITWNTAPGNDIAEFASVDSAKTALMGTISIANPVVLGQEFPIDVSPSLLANTDNIVQFILHNSSGLMQIGTHDHPTVAYRPYLTLVYPPAGADWPNPEIGETLTTDLPELSWTNPDPNDEGGIITCTVYLGTEPNRVGMTESVTLAADAESVAINETNFPTFHPLQDATTYYWTVDCYDSSLGGTIDGEWWSFNVYNNQAPTVDAGEPQVNWLSNDPNTVTLTGTAGDDGSPAVPGALSYTWQETSVLGTAVIASPDQLSTTVSFTAAGDYDFTLTADDGELQTSDTVRIVIGNLPCDASHVFTGNPYYDGDANEDCIVDLQDLIDLIVDDWLHCTDSLENCGN